MNRYPIYIVSKGRADTRLTSKALEEMNIPYHIVVEQHEQATYASVMDSNKILVLPESYLSGYDTCDNLKRTKSVGPGAARNFCWDHALHAGHARHWVLDDNIKSFLRFNRNKKKKVTSMQPFEIMEEFVDRYSNIAMAGPNYASFIPSKRGDFPPFVLNTRIYSCNLIKNDAPFRWRGRYNEDTDLSLRMLKSGLCTARFNVFLQEKAATQTVKGGNTKEFYEQEGTLPKSRMLVNLHPDVARLAWRYGRAHHHVDYRPFKANRLNRLADNRE